MMSELSGATPSQTVGPFLSIGLPWDDGAAMVADGTPGAVTVTGVLSDGNGDPVPDGLVEIWQADPDGRFPHPDDPRGGSSYAGFRNFGRAATRIDGTFAFRTLVPGPVPGDGEGPQAPHLDVLVFARGLLKHLVTRMYFPDRDNAGDPVLTSLPLPERALLTAVADGAGQYRFDIRLQGAGETPFFAV